MFQLDTPLSSLPSCVDNSTYNYLDVDTDSNEIIAFKRDIHNLRTGLADIPPLPTDRPPSPPIGPSSTLDDASTSPSPSPSQSSVSSESASSSPGQSPVHHPKPNKGKPAPYSVLDEPAWEVDSIFGRRKTRFGPRNSSKSGYDYKVRWKGNYNDTWEPEKNLASARDAIAAFERTLDPASRSPAFSSNTSDHDSVPRSKSMFTNLCNFVNIPFLCYLSGVSQPSPGLPSSEWKNIKVPNTRSEMENSPEAPQWLKAEREELDRLHALHTWERVSKPRKKALTCRWVYKLKPPTTLQPTPIFKARLVVHGYKQQAEIDYSSQYLFSQVATLKAFRILLWIAAFLGLRCTQLDVKTAFLYGDLDKEIYMRHPPGYEEIGCVLLRKSLYGLRQSPKIWYNTLIREFHSLGFRETVSDSCVFYHTSSRFYILIWVDDIILCTKNEQHRADVVSHLKSKFDIKDLGLLRHFVGLQIDYNTDHIAIHQHDYAEKLCDTFDDNDKTNDTPYDPNVKFSATQQPTTDDDTAQMSSYPYRQLLGSLLYLLITRPELYFIVIELSRFVCNPGIIHWLAALHVLRYVKRTTAAGLILRKVQQLKLTVYCDSDWASNTDDRKSTCGYIIYLGSFPIVWRSRRQKGKPATSSCEAEYRSIHEVLNEIVWIIAFLGELGFMVPTPVGVFCDNKSANDLAYNPVHHDRTKHIDIRYHRIREYVLDGTIVVHHVATKDNPADLFTKSVTGPTFNYLLNFIFNFSPKLAPVSV